MLKITSFWTFYLFLIGAIVISCSVENSPTTYQYHSNDLTNSSTLMKPGGGNSGKKGTIGYCVSVAESYLPSVYPKLVIPDTEPGKARWPNLAASWHPLSENVKDPSILFYSFDIEVYNKDTESFEYLEGMIPTLHVKTKKDAVMEVLLNLKDENKLDSYRKYYGIVKAPFPVETWFGDKENIVEVQVHRDMDLFERIYTGKGNKYIEEYVGTINIGIIKYDNYPECEWPQ